MNLAGFQNATMVSTETLVKLNQELRMDLLPVLIYLIVLMVIGIIGNGAVCYIYKSQSTKRTSEFFLVYLACLDLISCCVCIPFEISDVLLPIIFTSRAACKFFRFISTWLQGLSGLTLVCVAYARHRKIYRPLMELGKRVKICCVITVIVAFLIAAPALALFGNRTVKTRLPLVQGTECSTDDDVADNRIRIAYYTCLIVTFVFSLCCFLAFYILIGILLMKRKKTVIGESVLQHSGKMSPMKVSEGNQLGDNSVSTSQNGCKICVFSFVADNEPPSTTLGQLPVKTGRMTVIFLAVTISFVLSFLPFLLVKTIRASGVYFTSTANLGEVLIYNLCVRSTYINSAINPLIYSLLNRTFRRDVLAKIFKLSRSRKNPHG